MNNPLRKAYDKDGYVIVKGLFSKSEIEDFRKRISLNPNPNMEVLSIPSLRDIILDERILSVLRSILGDKIVYFGDSITRNENEEGTRGFHRDSQNDYEDPASTEYPIVRFGIYMQDHASHSGGLKVRQGSHRYVSASPFNILKVLFKKYPSDIPLSSLKFGKSLNLNIEAGDFVLWNLRTYHSGYAVRLKGLKSLSLNPKFEKHIPMALRRKSILPRMAIFCSFGVNSKTLEEYIKDRATHITNKEFWKTAAFDAPEVVQLCQQKNIELRFDGLHHSRSQEGKQ